MLFSDLFAYLSNNTLSRAELSNSGKVRNIHYGDVLIKYGEVIDIEHTEIPYVADVSRLRKPDYLSTGDVVIADTAEDDTVGKAVEIINNSSVAVVSGLHTIPCRPKKRFVPSYLGYYVNSAPFHTQLHPYMQGIKVTSISKGNIGKTYISSPDLEEQQKITSLLNLLSSRIEKQRQLVEALKSYKRGALSKLFPKKGETTPEYRFAGFTEPWKRRKALELAEYSKGNGYSKGDLTEKGTPIILYGRLYTKYQFAIDEVDTFAIPKTGSVYSQGNEVIVPASGETAEDIARASAVEESGVLLGGDLNILRPFDFINSLFLALAISNGEPQKELAKKAQGKSVVHIHNSDIQEITISYPLREEQDRIVAFFRFLEQLVALHQRKLNEYENIKAGLLQQLFV